MAENIDPGFLAAPFFGASSYDPIQAVKQAAAMRYEMGYAKKKDLAADMEKGLKDLNFDMKGWSDQQGFEEISTELENLRSKYTELGSRGINVARPNSMTEQRIAKGFNTALTNLKQKHDVWQEEKANLENAEKTITEELKKPEDQRTIDTEATLQNINDWKTTKGGVLDRAPKSSNIIITKATPVDIGTYFAKQFKEFLPGTDEKVTGSYVDQASGKFIISKWEGVDEKRAALAINKIANNINYAPPSIKNAIDKAYNADKETNPDSQLMTKAEWIKQKFLPESPIKNTKTASGTGGNINFGIGLPDKDARGVYSVQPQVRDIYYNSSTGNKAVVPFESVGRAPIASVFGFKPISIMGSVNNMNVKTGEKESVGEAVPAVPVELNMLPVAQSDMNVKIPNPTDPTKFITETFHRGDKIPMYVRKVIAFANDKARNDGTPPPYNYQYKPFVTLGLNHKQVKKEGSKMPEGMSDLANLYMDMSGKTWSYTSTSIVPYDEVKKDLFSGAKENKQDWKPYDDYVNQMSNQLNGSDKINSLFDAKEKNVDAAYNSLEN